MRTFAAPILAGLLAIPSCSSSPAAVDCTGAGPQTPRCQGNAVAHCVPPTSCFRGSCPAVVRVDACPDDRPQCEDYSDGSASLCQSKDLRRDCTSIELDYSFVSLLVVDVNGDGRSDLVGRSGGSYTVLLRAADGSFAALPTQPSQLGAPILADFDGDGHVDLGASQGGADDSTSGQVLWIAAGRGDGTFDKAQSVPLGFTPRAFMTLDVNGDKKADLIAVDVWSGKLGIVLGGSPPTVLPMQSIGKGCPVGSGCNIASSAADFNEDGYDDFLIYSDNAVAVAFGSKDGTLTLGPTEALGTGLPVDVNGDGHTDLVRLVASTSHITYSLGRGDGTFDAPVTAISTTPYRAESLFASDVTGDGRVDIVGVDTADHLLTISAGAPDATFDKPLFYQAPLGPEGSVIPLDPPGPRGRDLLIQGHVLDKPRVLRAGCT